MLFSMIGRNYIPYEGEVYYMPSVFDVNESITLMNLLLGEIPWQHDEIFMYGKKIITKRKVAWFGDVAYSYTYSQSTKRATSWNDLLLHIKEQVEICTGEKFNSCLLNLYHDGNEGMSWHSDNEKELKRNGTIASVSFGAERRFDFKHKRTKEKVSLTLEAGSVLVMKGEIQEHWLHQLPISKKVTLPRINLTFRTIVE